MNNQLIDDFKASFQDLTRADLSRLDRFYADDVMFRDPVHRIHGLTALQDYLAELTENVTECRFEFLDQLSGGEIAYLKWDMHFRHPRLAGGELLTVRGLTQLQFRERIYYHEDSYDLGQMLYEHVPLLGSMTRWLKSRLAG